MFIKKHLYLSCEFTDELKRKDIWQYPVDTSRGILINAVEHRDYDKDIRA